MSTPNVTSNTPKPSSSRIARRKTTLSKVQGSVENLVKLYHLSTRVERELGIQYYPRQQARMHIRSRLMNHKFNVSQIAGAFAVLSPNNAESTNYRALDICLHIVAGILPESTKVPAYPLNRQKALNILRYKDDDPLSWIKGQKVLSFYHNTLSPFQSDHLTVDGHMLGAWMGRRVKLRGEADIPPMEYELICSHIKLAANWVEVYPVGFQAILWLTWKRLQNILPYDPQLALDLEGTEDDIQTITTNILGCKRIANPDPGTHRALADQFRADLPAIL